VCNFTFYSEFLLPHLPHNPLRSPPTPNHCPVQILKLITVLFLHPTVTLSLCIQYISHSPCYSTAFSCLLFGTKTQTHIIEPNSVYPKLFFLNTPFCVQSVFFDRTAVCDIQLIRYKSVMYAHKPCGIIPKPTYYYHSFKIV